MSDTATDDFDSLVTDARSALEKLDSIDDLDALGDEERDSLVGNLDAVLDLVDEVDDLLEAIDFTDLPETIDAGEVLEAIQTGEIPDAIGEGDADEVVNVRRLVQAINLKELWGATDVGDLWETKRDLEETTSELTGEEAGDDENGVLENAADTMTDDDDDDGMVDDIGDAATDELADEFGSFDLGDGDGFGLDARDTEAYQTMIQQKAIEGIDEFREALIRTHGKFQELYEFNRERMRRQDRGTHSRNPTAVSSMPLDRADVPSTARHSTVPQQVRYSSAPSRRRIYGPRFEDELEKLEAADADRDGDGAKDRDGAKAKDGDRGENNAA